MTEDNLTANKMTVDKITWDKNDNNQNDNIQNDMPFHGGINNSFYIYQKNIKHFAHIFATYKLKIIAVFFQLISNIIHSSIAFHLQSLRVHTSSLHNNATNIAYFHAIGLFLANESDTLKPNSQLIY